MIYFDTLIHSGNKVFWPKCSNDLNINNVIQLIDNSPNLYGAIVQDSPYFEQYKNIDIFLNSIKEYNGHKIIVPCLSLPRFISTEIHKDYIENALAKGVRIFKVHPRFIDLNEKDLLDIIEYLINKELSIQICTYGYSNTGNQLFLHSNLFWEKLVKIALNARENSIMLMHMGGTDMLRVHNFIRHTNAFLGDLSMSYLKYRESSIANDIRFLLSNFDRRICIGSDYPEYQPEEIIYQISQDKKIFKISQDKLDNLLINNVLKFVDHKK